MTGTVTWRRLWSVDGDRLARFFNALARDDLRSRFGGPISAEAVRRHVRKMDWWRSYVIGAELRGALMAVGELTRLRAVWPLTAEAAITVSSPCQGRGLGAATLERLTRAARNRRVQRLWMICLADNMAMRRIAAKCGSSMTYIEGQVEARVMSPWPTPLTLVDEWLDLASGWTASSHGEEDAPRRARPALKRPIARLQTPTR